MDKIIEFFNDIMSWIVDGIDIFLGYIEKL